MTEGRWCLHRLPLVQVTIWRASSCVSGTMYALPILSVLMTASHFCFIVAMSVHWIARDEIFIDMKPLEIQ